MTEETPETVEPQDNVAGVTCSECQSTDVRLSRSSYPQDKGKVGEEAGSFWRCGNCGSRFLGPFQAATSSRRKRHVQKESLPRIDREILFARRLKRWVFPILAILATVLAVIYLLDQRDSAALPFLNPD